MFPTGCPTGCGRGSVAIEPRGNLRAMANGMELQHWYPEPPDRVREVLTDPDYLRDKLLAVGGPGAELVWHGQDDHDITIVSRHPIPSDALPPFLRSVRPEGLIIRRTETWTASGARVHGAVDGMLGTVTVVIRLKPDPPGCVLGAELMAEVPIPLVGRTAEKVITDNVAKLMTTEYEFTLDWLRNSEAP